MEKEASQTAAGMRDVERTTCCVVGGGPRLLLIGDAAHVMSPAGGVGIMLSEPLKNCQERLVELDTRYLAAVQRRRELPTRLTQRFQALIQQRVLAPMLEHALRPAPHPASAAPRSYPAQHPLQYYGLRLLAGTREGLNPTHGRSLVAVV